MNTDVVVGASATRHDLAHRVAALVCSVGVAVLRHYPLIGPHPVRAVPVIMTYALRVYRCIVAYTTLRYFPPTIRVADWHLGRELRHLK